MEGVMMGLFRLKMSGFYDIPFEGDIQMSINNNELEKDTIYAEFNKEFPIEKLRNLTLEEYTNTARSNSFCYWVEAKTEKLGSIWGGSAYKFGIFKIGGEIKGRKGTLSDNEYAWYSKYGKSREEAYKNVHSNIIRIVEAAQKGNFAEIDSIDLGKAYMKNCRRCLLINKV